MPGDDDKSRGKQNGFLRATPIPKEEVSPNDSGSYDAATKFVKMPDQSGSFDAATKLVSMPPTSDVQLPDDEPLEDDEPFADEPFSVGFDEFEAELAELEVEIDLSDDDEPARGPAAEQSGTTPAEPPSRPAGEATMIPGVRVLSGDFPAMRPLGSDSATVPDVDVSGGSD
ncbi:MAG: hypothetical protein KC561_15030, partial [Myxococcales bacterium]|nr:hypothetical protein [Myxococcales bacterium]